MFFKKTDIIIIISIVFLSIAFWWGYNFYVSDRPAMAEIYYKSELVQIVDLSAGVDKTFSIPQNENVVFHLYKDGSIRFEQSNCKDKICINTGRIHKIGESAACLPNEIIMKIVPAKSRNEDDPDIIIK